MSEKSGLRQRWRRIVRRSTHDRALDSGESTSERSGPSEVLRSITSSTINSTPSLGTPRTVVAPLGNPLPGEVSIGPFTAAAQSASSQSRFGLFPLTTALCEEDLNQKGPDIVAIHRITGDYIKTWTHPQGALWLRDFLPEDISVPARVFSFGYDAQVKFSVSKAKLEDFARSLLLALNRVRREKVRSLNFILIVERIVSNRWRHSTNWKLESAIKTFGIHLP